MNTIPGGKMHMLAGLKKGVGVVEEPGLSAVWLGIPVFFLVGFLAPFWWGFGAGLAIAVIAGVVAGLWLTKEDAPYIGGIGLALAWVSQVPGWLVQYFGFAKVGAFIIALILMGAVLSFWQAHAPPNLRLKSQFIVWRDEEE